MTDTHGLTVQQADALWDAVAAPGPDRAPYPVQHERVCKTVARLLAERPMQDVQGRCPACRGASLFLGSGGHVTCARLDCPNPCAADQLLHGETEPAPSLVEICELPHQTIAEEEECERQRLAAARAASGPEEPPAPTEAARAASAVHEGEKAVNRVREAVATDQPALAATEATDAPDTVTDPEWLRQQYAAAVESCGIESPFTCGEIADAVLRVRDRHLAQLRQRLQLADHELQQWAAAESADAAAGSYAHRAETAEQQRDQLAGTLREVLDAYQGNLTRAVLGWKTHPAYESALIARWRTALDQTQEQP